jgi:hypothetical protein
VFSGSHYSRFQRSPDFVDSIVAAGKRAAKRKRGRPRKHVDLELVEKLAHIQCTHSEIPCALNVSVDTLWRTPKFAEVY